MIAERNPVWADRAISNSWKLISAASEASGLPMPLRGVDRKKFKEFGCGFWGCVYPTQDSNVVFKLTLDTTEILFIQNANRIAVWPVGITEYYAFVDIGKRKQEGYRTYGIRQMYGIWREALVGANMPKTKDACGSRKRSTQEMCRSARLLNMFYLLCTEVMEPSLDNARSYRRKISEHEAMTKALDNLQQMYKSSMYDDAIDYALSAAKTLAESMANDTILREIGMAILFYMKHGMLLADTHSENVGQVRRNGKLIWVVSDVGSWKSMPSM
ncbi:MAG: hypothetical protein ACYTEQ_05370 [Planctomycetota bacterium]|jgi:hypothetical protein